MRALVCDTQHGVHVNRPMDLTDTVAIPSFHDAMDEAIRALDGVSRPAGKRSPAAEPDSIDSVRQQLLSALGDLKVGEEVSPQALATTLRTSEEEVVQALLSLAEDRLVVRRRRGSRALYRLAEGVIPPDLS